MVYRVLLGHGYHGYRLTALHGMTRHARPWDPTASWPGFGARVKLMAGVGLRPILAAPPYLEKETNNAFHRIVLCFERVSMWNSVQ